MWVLSEVFNLAVAQIWQVTIVAVLVGLISYVLRARRWHPSVANSLWLLVLVKALTPPVVASPTGIFSWRVGSSSVSNLIAVEHVDGAIASWAEISFACFANVWLVGFAATLGTQYLNWRKLLALIESTAQPDAFELNVHVSALSARLGLRHAPELRVTRSDLGPALVGIRRPMIVLPRSLVQESAWEEIKPIVAHELLHLRRRDTAISVLQLLANAVWWFHPLVRWAGKQVEEASERCVDLAVLHVAGCDQAAYCRSLVKVLESRCETAQRLLVATPAVRGASVTCERVRELTQIPPQPSFTKRLLNTICVCGLTLVLLPGRPLSVLTPGDIPGFAPCVSETTDLRTPDGTRDSSRVLVSNIVET